ncbi:flagellar protein FlgN [Paenibacillus sp. YN15]|uniref:flagellar protein FlgN n=1 Tax=Paenibacillus sp. YN15 TaxID=1742774 RepID=UPI000DCD8574|nr:flagellar protein FlgN [Paenibacillus sp. YN15]RAV03109.1 flagellar protein FlgN [Paenibacillus sp. YN15]
MSINDVIQCLEEMNLLYAAMLDLACRKKEVLIANRVEDLNQIVHKENLLVRQLNELEGKRTEAVNAFLVQKCYRPNPKISVSDLIVLLFKAEDKARLQQAQQTLSHTLSRLKEANELNQQLIRQSLAFIEYSMDLVLGPPEDDVVYHNPSAAQQGYKRTGMFDSRA